VWRFHPSSAFVAFDASPSDDEEPKKFHPLYPFDHEEFHQLDSFAPEDLFKTLLSALI